jgi:hypothetical protein
MPDFKFSNIDLFSPLLQNEPSPRSDSSLIPDEDHDDFICDRYAIEVPEMRTSKYFVFLFIQEVEFDFSSNKGKPSQEFTNYFLSEPFGGMPSNDE